MDWMGERLEVIRQLKIQTLGVALSWIFRRILDLAVSKSGS